MLGAESIMYLKKSYNSKTGRTQLAIVHGYYDSVKKTTRAKTIKSIGYLDVLEKEYEDPVAYFTAMAKKMDEEFRANKEITFSFSSSTRMEKDTLKMNLGYFALANLYHQWEIHKFFKKFQRNKKLEYNLTKVMELLVYSRILYPSSKKKAFDNKNRYFEKFDFSLDDVYRALSYFNDCKEDLQSFLHQQICNKYNRDTSLVYYDVTNYYFELDYQDEWKRKGVSKEHRPEPIVQMGLLMDSNSIPISYRLFPGNTNDCETLLPVLADLKKKYNSVKMIVVADKGLNTYKNIVLNTIRGNGYVFSQSIRKAHKELKTYVLDPSGYSVSANGFKIKSRIYPKEVTVQDIRGKSKKIRIDEKQVIFYSPDYAARAKHEREVTIKKAYDFIANPSKYNSATSYGCTKYINNVNFNKETGEIIKGQALSFNIDKLREEEKYDGYYAIITSELDKQDSEIIDIYRGLWRIEESFKITKSTLETRPVYVSRGDHIQGHFLTCFLSLLLLRLLEQKLNYNYSIPTLIDALKSYNAINLDSNIYKFTCYNQTLEDIGNAFDVDLSISMRTRKDIKNILASVKKREKRQ